MVTPIEWLVALALGALQGVTEFLPISSSGHLLLVPWAAGWHFGFIEGLTFTVALHVGTGVAAVGAMAKHWKTLLIGAVRNRDNAEDAAARRMLAAIILATALVGAVGFKTEALVANSLRAPWIAGLSLAFGGLILYATDRFAAARAPSAAPGLLALTVVGLAQAIALIPGVSRSGATITVGRALGFSRLEATRFSFLLMGPVIFGAAGLQSFRLVQRGATGSELALLGAATVVSALTGAVAARWLLAFISKASFAPFALYRAVLGLAMLGLFLAKS